MLVQRKIVLVSDTGAGIPAEAMYSSLVLSKRMLEKMEADVSTNQTDVSRALVGNVAMEF